MQRNTIKLAVIGAGPVGLALVCQMLAFAKKNPDLFYEYKNYRIIHRSYQSAGFILSSTVNK